LHCEIRLKALAGKFHCGICKSKFSASDLKAQVKGGQLADAATLDFAREYLKAQKQLEEERRPDLSILHTDQLTHVSNWKLAQSFFGIPTEEDEIDHGFPIFLGIFSIVCVAVFLFASKALSLSLALSPENLFRMFGLNFFSYSFVHADIFHLMGNLFFIIPFMDNVEYKLGSFKVITFILLSAIASAVLHILFDHSKLPLVGASGVCFAIVTYYSVKFPKNRLLIMPPILGIFAMRYRLRVKARTLVIFYVLKEFLGIASQVSGASSTSHLGHIGGALVGLLFAYLVSDEN